MDWIPHIVVKASKDACAATTTTALKTFETGFPGHKATVHYIGSCVEAQKYCQKWCKEGGHKLIQYLPSIRQSRIHHEIVRGTRLPVVLIRGTAIFYNDMSEYSTTKVFGGTLWPEHHADKINGTPIRTLECVDKTIIFVAKPMEVIKEVNKIFSYEREDTDQAAGGYGLKKWDRQTIVLDGQIIKQASGIFNLLYHWDKTLMAKFNKKTFEDYETVPAGNNYVKKRGFEEGNSFGEPETLMKYINAALNEDFDALKGCMKYRVDGLKKTVVK